VQGCGRGRHTGAVRAALLIVKSGLRRSAGFAARQRRSCGR